MCYGTVPFGRITLYNTGHNVTLYSTDHFNKVTLYNYNIVYVLLLLAEVYNSNIRNVMAIPTIDIDIHVNDDIIPGNFLSALHIYVYTDHSIL